MIMRIVFVSSMSGSSWGGSEILWHETAIRLHNSGHIVMASVNHWTETPAPIILLRKLGVTVQERQWSPTPWINRTLSKVLRGIFFKRGMDLNWSEIVEFKPDLVCVSSGDALSGIDWMVRCKDASIPYVSVAHANFEQWWPNDTLVTKIAEVYTNARKAYFVSKANLELFERQLATSLPRAEVIFNPCSVPMSTSIAWPSNVEAFQLACVARLEPGAKGQDLLFQVMAQPKWRMRRVTVSLFGSGRWEMGLRRLVSLDGIADKIRFVGHVEDIVEVWKTHHALVLPSRFEGLPLTIVEAMMCGRPVIVTDVAGNRELLDDGITGFIAEAPTFFHLDEAMERAWQRRNEWQAIGKAAKESIHRQIPVDPARIFADDLLALCDSN
jgi:glycosyltransferase involved in cell wall biosynthesis